MKEGWAKSIFTDVCKVINGRAYSKDEMLAEGKYRLLRVGNFFTNDSWYYSDLELEEDKYCEDGDLLYAWSASFGPRIWHGEKTIYHYHIWKLICTNKIDKHYLCYWLESETFKKQVMKSLHGATMMHVTKAIMEHTQVNYPIEISEQQQIVDFLDAEFAKIDELKNQAEQSLQNAKDLFQAALKEMLTPKEGWKECKMGNICELSQGLAINAKTRHLLVEKSSIPLLRIKDMKEGTREIFVDEKLFPPACLANKEDLIYTRTGTLGLIFTGMYGILHNNCFKIKIVEKDINKSFYMYFVGSDSFRTQITKLASRAAQPDITHKLFKEQLFQYPSISEQRDIVNKLNIMQERITALQSNYSRTIQLCADLRQALLRQVFE